MSLPSFSHGLVVHSPSANIGGSLKRIPVPWFMEPWARDEIEDWAEWHGYDRELARKLFDIAGGAIPIHVDSITSAAKQRKIDAGDEGKSQSDPQDPCETARAIISDAVKSMFYGTSESTASSNQAQHKHWVLHWYPEAENRTQHQIFFCSHYARQMYLKARQEKCKMRDLLMVTAGCFSSADGRADEHGCGAHSGDCEKREGVEADT
jgi:hypothetical protein